MGRGGSGLEEGWCSPLERFCIVSRVIPTPENGTSAFCAGNLALHLAGAGEMVDQRGGLKNGNSG